MQFASALDQLITSTLEGRAGSGRTIYAETGRLMDLYIRFHSEGIMALPYSIPYFKVAKYPRYEWSWGRSYPLFRKVLDFVGGEIRRNHMYKFRGIMKLFLATQGAAELIDLTPDVDGGLVFDANEGQSETPSVFKTLIQLMRLEHPELAIPFNADAYGHNKPLPRMDGAFSWVEAADPALAEFAGLAASWVQATDMAFSPNVAALNRFFDFLIAHPSLPRNAREFLIRPEERVRRNSEADLHSKLRGWLVNELGLSEKTVTLPDYINRTRTFLDRILTEHCAIEGVIPTQFSNPIRREDYRTPTRNETNRSALPLKFVRMLKDIIRAPYTITGSLPEEVAAQLNRLRYERSGQDRLTGKVLPDSVKKLVEEAGARVDYGFEWPQRQRRESFRWHDAERGEFVDVWSPLRTYFTLVKLELPLRSFQVIALESSEADPEMYVPGVGWVVNPAPVAAPIGKGVKESRFVLRRMLDDNAGQEYVGLFINTNKTRDQARGEIERGYQIPWEHQEAIRLFSELDSWQRLYNPIREAVSWAKVPQLEDRFKRAALESRPFACFLFRDPVSEDPRYPLSRVKLEGYWENLLAELEERVCAAGLRNRDDSRIVFVDECETRGKVALKYRVPRYDLHSLRVTLITAFAEIGVPISLLSKFVAGHASIVMTLYYAKFGVAHVTSVLNEAALKMEKEEQAQYERFLASATYEDIVARAALNDPIAAEMLKKHDPGAWVVSDIGVCPVGCSRCHEGGEPVLNRGREGQHVHGPVPGGNQNCVRCRFFISGAAFVIGLTSHFNEVGCKLMEQSRRYNEVEQKLEALEEERYVCESERRPFLKGQQLSSMSETFSLEGKDLDETARTWHAAHRLIGRCLSALYGSESKSAGNKEGMSLVLAGNQHDLRAALRTTTDFDLVDSVCQSADFFERVDATMPSLRRADIINSMLAANHRKPIFAQLTDDQKLAVGNEMVKLLVARSSYGDMLALMDGRKTLDLLGLEAVSDMDRLLEGAAGQAIKISYQPPRTPAALEAADLCRDPA